MARGFPKYNAILFLAPGIGRSNSAFNVLQGPSRRQAFWAIAIPKRHSAQRPLQYNKIATSIHYQQAVMLSKQRQG